MDLSKQFTSSLTHVKRLGNTPFVSEDIVQINEEKSEYVESINFQTDKYAVAKSGGGIVVAHACNQDDDGYYKKLVVYNSFLKKICDIPLKYDKKLTKLFFTQEECVIAVFGDGTLVSFNLRGHVIKENKLCTDEAGFIDFVEFWDNGVFIKYGRKIYIVDNFSTLNSEEFGHFGTSIVCAAAVPPNDKQGTDALLWAADGEANIMLFQRSGVQQLSFPEQITRIIFSPDYEFCFVQCESNFYICDDHISEVIYAASFDDFEPTDIKWVGSDAVALVNYSMLVIVGACPESITWNFFDPFGLSSEVDGLRVFAKDEVMLIRAIPDLACEFAIWNTKSCAVQIFSKMHDEEGLALADPLPPYTYQQIDEAIRGMLEASVFFRNFTIKVQLLTALSRTIMALPQPKNDGTDDDELLISLKDSSIIENNLKTLRICEQMNREPYFIPITFEEFNDLTVDTLIKRLCNRELHFPAFRIAQFVPVETDFVISNWVVHLVDSIEDDDEVIERVKGMKEPLDLINVASAAFEKNRTELAYRLLELNPSKAKGVPLLVQKKAWDQAIYAAAESNDVSLLLYTLNEARAQGAEEAIKKCVKKYAIARDSWSKVTVGDEKLKMLKLSHREQVTMLKQAYEESEKCPKGVESYQADIYEFLLQIRQAQTEIVKRKIPSFPPAEKIMAMSPNEFFEFLILNNCMCYANRIAKLIGITDVSQRMLRIGIKYKSRNVIAAFRKTINGKDLPIYLKILQDEGVPELQEPLYTMVDPPPDPAKDELKPGEENEYEEELDEKKENKKKDEKEEPPKEEPKNEEPKEEEPKNEEPKEEEPKQEPKETNEEPK